MKWLGEHIWDFISRFRNDVYLELASKLYFRDTNSYINSPTANDLEIVATDITLDAATDIRLEGTTVVTGVLRLKSSLVKNLLDNATIPITQAFQMVDAVGTPRTGIRFEGQGEPGDVIYVWNSGGETLTFHPTISTCLVRGLTTSLDTMEPAGVYHFVSDGTYWNFIGGGTFPGEGLTAS